ncbi:hypothetical protein NG798_03180 [Ancylothrix sp. C2]|uniref:hypothetical protein n=1 Tax=Ancylothrix sp. D3o TaxID=2953691 RepID=UPI0021BACF46|nr:hypothetical protein [Ancylothrix sp. D3o]MCT7948782.1 hypothetical protein [Ancylothrix sp. D3o]
MKTLNCLTSACRHCRFYQPQGRRGGHCAQLDAPVRGTWKACSLAIPPFAPSWETLEEIKVWEEEMLGVPQLLPIDGSFSFANTDDREKQGAETPAQLVEAFLS